VKKRKPPDQIKISVYYMEDDDGKITIDDSSMQDEFYAAIEQLKEDFEKEV
jgi:hypothetical protein